MANSNLSTLYGPTGNQQLQNRFAVEGDPRPSIPIRASGGIVSNSPAHTLGLSGAAYRYGSTVVGSSMNLVEIAGTLVAPTPFVRYGPVQTPTTISFNLGVVAGTNSPYNVMADSWNYRYTKDSSAPVMVDGEWMVYGGTPTLFGEEDFTSAGTVTVTNGNHTITGSGTAFTTANLAFSYVYTPANAHPTNGDIIKVTHPVSGVVYYRILSVVDATHLIVFPTPTEATASGCAYTLMRSGYDSYSRVVTVIDHSIENNYYYYAGMGRNLGTGLSQNVIMATGDALLFYNHRMSQTGPQASDIALYKSFLLYGDNSTIGWSQAGFPLAFPFGDCSTPALTDFPAANISVQSLDSSFVSFEYLGDQLVAFFGNKIVLIQSTGSVPEFQFYDLPEPIGTILPQYAPDSVQGHKRFRPTCSARGAVYYLSSEGVNELSSGGLSSTISDPVADILPTIANLHWDHVTDSIIVEAHGIPLLAYQRQSKAWTTLSARNGFGVIHNELTQDFALGIAGSGNGSFGYPRRIEWAYYDTVNKYINTTSMFGTEGPIDRPTANPDTAWVWPSPIINLSDVYTSFKFTGLRIDAESLGVANATLTWTVYGGASPYNMNVRYTGQADYTNGTSSARNLTGTKIDDAFAAVVLTGTPRIKLLGVSLYDATYQSRK